MDVTIIICIAAFAAIVFSALGIVRKDEKRKEAQAEKEKAQH